MIVNLLIWLVLLVVTVVFGWLTLRSWRAKNALVRWAGVLLSGLLTLVLALVCILTASGFYQFYAPRGSPVETLTVAGTPEQVARGEKLARIECVGCHTINGDLPLSGGRNIGEESPMPLGNFYSINLTPGGPLKDWTDGEIMRVLNEGVDRNGHPLIAMSANTVRYFSDEDKQAVIAYLRSQPEVINDTPNPPDQPNILAAALVGTGMLKFQPPVRVIAPPKGPTAEYGAYIVGWVACQRCHGDDFKGGTGGQAGLEPKGPSLRVVQDWTVDQFVTTLRTGVDPTGHSLDGSLMPWKEIGLLDDVELGALYAYLKNLPSLQS